MSGGFFRGTSADQDTRFSNKQAKLLKSQKFAPELEHLVDMKKVKMDVIRPWIANRVTEFLGFEDEVLINFIYGLLDAKEVNGKQVQISLTGFMEKNTGKFMKELWTLLLSAQKNESGVPQQFLDAKEEETRKKQAEMDRITNEIQRKKEESKELERARSKKMDGGAETKANAAALEPASKHLPKGLSGDPEDDKEIDNRNGVRGRNRSSRSANSAGRSSSSPRGSPSHGSRSFSNSRSYSGDKHKSRSLSRSPDARRRGISPNRIYRSPRKRSVTPRGRYSSRDSPSPSRRITSYSRQRSRSSSRRKSPSPVLRRLRSPFRRRSPSPARHRRSPSPVRRRRSPPPVRRRRSPPPVRRRRSPSPTRRRRSPSPARRHRSPSPSQRHRSPSPARHRRSPSPVRRRRSPSPVRRRRSPSPVRRRKSPPLRQRRSPSPAWHSSPFPVRRISPSPLRRRSPSPLRQISPSLVRHRYQRSPSTPLRESPSPRRGLPIHARRRSQVASPRRSPSPYGSSSPSPIMHRIHSSVRRSSKEHRMSPVESLEEGVSMQQKSFSAPRRPSSSLRLPDKDGKDLSSSPRRSPVRSEPPPLARTGSSSEDRRSISPYESPVRQIRGQRKRPSSSSGSPVRQRREHITHDDSLSPPTKPREQKPYHRTPESSKEDGDIDYARDYKARSSQKRSIDSSIINKQNDSPVKVQSKDKHSSERVGGRQAAESQSRLDIVESRKRDQEIKSEKGNRKRASPETPEGHMSLMSYKDPLMEERRQMSYAGGQKSDEKGHSRSNDVKDNDKHHKSEISHMLVEKTDQSNGGGAFDSGSEESDKCRTESKEKRRHKRSHKEQVASDNDDSYDSEIEKKEAKRRRKEEKKQRKEEKRRRREERRRRRKERRAEKLKVKDPNNTNSSDDEHSGQRESHPSDGEDTQSEQKKLEIELRKKALESLKAKKGISH